MKKTTLLTFIRTISITFLLLSTPCLTSCQTCQPCKPNQAVCVANTPSADFYFVQVTDAHFGQGDHDRRMNKLVAEINNLKLDIKCVVVTGDIYHHADDNAARLQAKETLGKIRFPVHVLPGNHDIPGDDLETELGAFEESFGSIFQTATYDDVVFLFTYLNPNGKIRTKDGASPIEWTAQALDNAGDSPVLVFNHIPCIPNFYNNDFHGGWPEDQKEAWIDLLNRHNVRAVIAGHLHGNVLSWLGRVPLMVSSSISGSFGRQSSYRIYRYTNGKLSYWTVYIQPVAGNVARPFISAKASTQGSEHTAAAAVDGNPKTRWESHHQDGPEWLMLEFEKQRTISEVFIDWETASAADYDIQLSTDGQTWTTVASITDAPPDEDRVITFDPTPTKFIRLIAKKRATQWGYSIWELDAY